MGIKFNMSKEEVIKKKYVFLFSSDQRPVYKQDNLKILCYPSGYIIHFRYDEKYVQPGLTPNLLINEDAVVVIVGRSAPPLFFPARKAVIKNVIVQGSIWHIYFELSTEWVNYENDNYDSLIHSLNNKPEWNDPHLGGKFLSLEEISQDFQFSNGEKVWEKLIEKIVSRLSTYSDVIFYKINQLKELKENDNGTCLNPVKFDKFSSGYKLKCGKKYILDLTFNYGRDPPTLSEESSMKFKLEEDSFYKPIPEEILLGFKADKQRIYLAPKKTFQNSISYFKSRISGEIDGVELDIPLKITKSRWLYLGFIGIGLGLLFTTGFLSNFLPVLEKIDNLIQILGVIITTLIITYLYEYK